MATSSSPTSIVGNGWRVKLYELEAEGAWVDKGTGYAACRILSGVNAPGLVVTNEEKPHDVLLRSRIRFDENYELQGGELMSLFCEYFVLICCTENIIMWRELNDNPNQTDTDYALSFQEAAGCNQIWLVPMTIHHSMH